MILNQFKLETFIMSDYLISLQESTYLFDGYSKINLQIIDRYGSISQNLYYTIEYFDSFQLRNIQYFLNRKEHFNNFRIRYRISQLKYVLCKIMRKRTINNLQLYCIFTDNDRADLIFRDDNKLWQIKRSKLIRKFQLPKNQEIINATFSAYNTVVLTKNHFLYFFSNKDVKKQKPFKIIQQITHIDQIFTFSQDQRFLFYGDYLASIQPFKVIIKQSCQYVQFSECSKYLALYAERNRFFIVDLCLKQKTHQIYIPFQVKLDFMYYDFQSMKIIKENFENGYQAIYKLIVNEEIINQIEGNKL